MNALWKSWRQKNQKGFVVIANVDVASDDVEIANKFAGF